VIFIAGLLSIVVQVVMLRELSAAFYGVDLIYLLALAAWLLWSAAGAVAGRTVLAPSRKRLAGLLLAIGVAVPLDVALVRDLRRLLGGVRGAYLPLPGQIAASVFSLLVPGLLLGLLFQWAAKRYLSPDSAGRTLARAYAMESAGGLCAGLITTWTLHWGVGALQLTLGAAAVCFAAAALVVRGSPSRPYPGVRTAASQAGSSLGAAVALVLLSGCLVALWQARRLDLWMAGWNHPQVIETLDTPYGRTTVTRGSGQTNVYENDALVFESGGTDAEELACLSLLQCAMPKRVLLVEGASLALIPEVAAHRPDFVEDIELDRRHTDLLARLLPARFGASLLLPFVHTAIDDPRRAIAACDERVEQGCGEPYDVIVVASGEPASAQANRFYTREFFEQCAGRLGETGVLSFRLPSVENYWTPPMTARTGSIYRALAASFRDVVVLPGATNIVLASRGTLTRDPDLLAARMEERGIRGRLVSPRYLHYLYSNDRYEEIRHILDTSTARPNTDATPVCYQATAVLWLSKFMPSLGQADFARVSKMLGWSGPGSWVLLFLFALPGLASRRRPGARGLVMVGSAAFAGMSLETLLLVHYQLKRGVVFGDIGILLTSVMAGLAAGAWLVDRSHRKCSPAPFLLALALLGLVISVMAGTGHASSLAEIALVLGATGAAVAGTFAAVSLEPGADQRRLVSPLYAVDLLGGSLGSVAASLVMIPLAGLPFTAEWSAAAMGVALLATRLQGRRSK
jgi:spermidine synthase